MLEAEAKLAGHLQIVMHDWPEEAKQNTIDHVLAALAEQRETERDRCAKIADAFADDSAALGPGFGSSDAADIAAAIRTRAANGD